jgi:hypothetical protein
MSGFVEFMRLFGEAFGVGLSLQVALLDSIVTFFSNLPSLIKSGIEGGLATLQAKIEEIKTYLIDTFGSIDLFEIGKKIIQSLIDGIVNAIPGLRDTINTVQGWLQSMGVGGGPGGGELPKGSVGSATINGVPDPSLPLPAPIDGARAAGGPLWNGWFLAGEKGPELGYASGSGHMFNASETKRMLTGANSNAGPGMAQTNHFHFHGTPEENAREVSRLLDRQLQRSRGLSMEDRTTFG